MLDGFDPRWNDARDRDANDGLDREIYRDSRERGDDPRGALLNDLDLPRGLERELVLDRDRVYELNVEDSRMLAAVGAFRVIPERDLDSRDESRDCRNDSLGHLVDEGLIRTVSLDGHDRGVTLTDRGRDLLEANRRDRGEDRQQEFYAGVNRPRELSHDAQLYRAYQRTEKELRDDGAEIRRVVLEQELKRDYQSFLQDHNRGRPDSDGRPDRDAREIAQWALEHELPYFDDRVHFPDFRIEYDHDGREGHRDVEVMTPHYRGAHAASRGRTGFTCVQVRTGGRSGRWFEPGVAEDLL
jgi:DNA-binding PadR family transcriptional regulator